MINVKDIESRAKEIDALGVDYICVHTGYDLQAEGKNSFEELTTIKNTVKTQKPQSRAASNLIHCQK